MPNISQPLPAVKPLIKQIVEYHTQLFQSNMEQLEKRYKKSMSHITAEGFAQLLERYDDDFAQSTKRKSEYIIKQKRYRTVITLLGAITYRRREYIHKQTGKSYCHCDRLLQIKPYERITPEVVNEIMEYVTDYSYRKLVKDVLKLPLSHSVVYNALHNIVIDAPTDFYNDFEHKHEVAVLYLQMDEIYIPEQDAVKEGHKFKLHLVTLHEGTKPICKGRNKLVNKLFFAKHESESLSAFKHRVVSFIEANYIYDTIYVYGDGANWIARFAQELNAPFLLDKFHFKRDVHALTTNEDDRLQLLQFIREDKRKDFVQYAHQCVSHWTPFRNQRFIFLINHWEAIQLNYTLPYAVGCSQEGINFHYFAKRLTTLPSGWSSHNLHVIAQLAAIKHSTNTNFSEMIHTLTHLDTTIYSVPHTVGQSSTVSHVLHKSFLPLQFC